MPSHVCHILFAEEAVARAIGGDGLPVGRLAALLRFGAQGPDFFYHNGLSRPSARTFGALLHRRCYGTAVRCMAERLAREPSDELRAFLLGFATHPFLDRAAHPFIDYFAGWEDPGRPDTHGYYRCHAFYERILDVLYLEQRRGVSAAQLLESAPLDCGAALPAAVTRALGEALQRCFPGLAMTADAERRVENAYRDAQSFYSFTSRLEFRALAARRDRRGPDRRRLALFHPVGLPTEIDFLNSGHRRWVHPCDESRVSHASFGEIFEGALDAAAAAARSIAALAEQPAEAGFAELEALVGNDSLNTESRATGPRRFSDPLPLPQILSELYRSEGQ